MLLFQLDEHRRRVPEPQPSDWFPRANAPLGHHMLKKVLRDFNEQVMFPRRYDFLTRRLSPYLKGCESILDVGSSNGRLISQIAKTLDGARIAGVDVKVQPGSVIPISEYDGVTLPFADDSFDCVVLIDVLHHAEDPIALLAESCRVAKKNVLIKDHYWNNQLDWFVLKWADYFGNDPSGIQLPYNYFKVEAWHRAFQVSKLTVLTEKLFTQYSYDPCKHVIYHLEKAAPCDVSTRHRVSKKAPLHHGTFQPDVVEVQVDV